MEPSRARLSAVQDGGTEWGYVRRAALAGRWWAKATNKFLSAYYDQVTLGQVYD